MGKFRLRSFHKYCTQPTAVCGEVEVEGSIFVGMEIAVKVIVLCEKAFKLRLSVEVGPELSVSAKETIDAGNAAKKHSCVLCFEGNVHYVLEVDLALNIVKIVDEELVLLELKIPGPTIAVSEADVEVKLVEATLPKSGVVTESKYPAVMQTDENGYLAAYLAAGEYEAIVTKDNIVVKSKFKVEEAEKEIALIQYYIRCNQC